MTAPATPFWFKQRQCQVEAVGDNFLKLTGPILPEAFIRIEPEESGSWRAAVRTAADGPDERTATDLPGTKEAWEAAFELYRLHLIT